MKLKNLILGGFVAGSLMLPAGAVSARTDWRDIRNDQARLESDDAQLTQARRQLEWDLEHRASAYQIERDHRAIQSALDDFQRDHELMRRDTADYENFS
jgi:hypothetical protein